MWRSTRIGDREFFFWDEGQPSRRYFNERPDSWPVTVPTGGCVVATAGSSPDAYGWRPPPPPPPPRFSDARANARRARLDASEGEDLDERIDRDARRLFGLPDRFSRAELRRAYAQLAKRHHPDQGGQAEKLRLVVLLYERLGAQAVG